MIPADIIARSDASAPQIKIVMDMMQGRPACVLLQAAFGGDSHRVSALFDASTWLLAPTPDMRMVTGTLEQWKACAARLNKEHSHKIRLDRLRALQEKDR